jgi:hypothetical protein
MELDQHHPAGAPGADVPPKRSLVTWGLNLLVVAMVAAAGYFGYAYLKQASAPATPAAPAASAASPAKPPKVIQLDVLNGCGAKGAGVKFTGYLRSSGFDVVEMKNYKTFTVTQTLVIDRIGDLAQARRVAAALGVAEKNVIQQINPDYFVDVSVVIGADYTSLRLTR